jgi:hypothetical protein
MEHGRSGESAHVGPGAVKKLFLFFAAPLLFSLSARDHLALEDQRILTIIGAV